MKNKKNYLMSEEIDNGEDIETLEENLSVEGLTFNNPNLVRVDMNIVEYPLFSKNSQRKKNQAIKYYFNDNRNIYIKIDPIAGDYIPGEFEEKVFIGLLKAMKKRQFPQSFYITASELLAELNLENKIYYKKVKQSLLRLSKTSYEFKNTLYLSKIKNKIEDTISTNILNIRIVELSKEEKIKNIYNDKRVKEVYEINISKYFYENIIRKGYMVYDANVLLGIESPISRTIYMLIHKIRFQKLYLKLPVIFLIKRIPLKYDDKNMGRTVKILEKACNELLLGKYIDNFNVLKNGNWKDSEIEFFFNQTHNEIKQINFYDDKNHFDSVITISHTEESSTILKELKTEISDKQPTEENISKILELLPKKARELKTFSKFLEKSIKKYGLNHVTSVAEYVKIQNPKSILGYFTSALENNWAEEYILKNNQEKVKIKEIEKEEKIETVELELQENIERIYDKFLNLEEHDQKQIENEVYKMYINEAGIENKAVKLAFKNAKRKLIVNYLLKMEEEKYSVSEKSRNEEVKSGENKNVVYVEKKYEDIIEFKFEVFEYLNGKMSSNFIKNILDFIQIESMFIGVREGYKLNLKYISDEISKIYIEKLD